MGCPFFSMPASLSAMLGPFPLLDITVGAQVVAYVLGLAVLGRLVPGRVHTGATLSDGTKAPTYKINGLLLFDLLLFTGAMLWYKGAWTPTYVVDNMTAIFTWANVIALGMSTWLFARGVAAGRVHLSQPVHALVQFWEGTELTPRLLGENLKFFWLRPSMMAWAFINLAFLVKQYETLGHVTLPMAVYQLFTMFYVVDYFFVEHKMTSTWDIIAENFGFMLVWGDLVFIPFWFSLQCYVLLSGGGAAYTHTWWYTALTALCFAIGFAIFRGANNQKNEFKTHGKKAVIWGSAVETIGGKLLCSGWWGLARHSNYLGDILLAVSFAMPCGLSSVVGWLYPIYLTALLIDRERRDERRCAAKYGVTWKAYCKRVPYRIVPYVF
jgi:delta14-sterol reductase